MNDEMTTTVQHETLSDEIETVLIKTAPAEPPAYKLKKAEESTQLDPSVNTSIKWVPCPHDRALLRSIVEDSTILPQCIKAYSANVAGFGIGVRFKDNVEDETDPAMQAELTECADVIDGLCADYDTKNVFESVIEARETYGAGYIEVVRDFEDRVVSLDFLRGTEYVKRSVQDTEYTDYITYKGGKPRASRKRFSKYKQTVGLRTVYFKEFGDPRIMDNRTGDYVDELDVAYQANELLEFKNGTSEYGDILWSGLIVTVDGARKAEKLNYNYFVNGRHTPLLFVMENGTLTPKSMRAFQDYMSGVKGEAGQFKILLMALKPNNKNQYDENPDKPSVQIHNLASMMQGDELFGNYIDDCRKKVQSAFRLPDLYVGYTTEFNRATAQTAMKVTEQQVFQTMRKDLAWVLNNKILAGYGFEHVEAFFNEPDLSNPDDLYKLMSVTNNAGGLTPNKALDIISRQLGEQSDGFEESWGEIPLPIQQTQGTATGAEPVPYVPLAKGAEPQGTDATEELISVMKYAADVIEKAGLADAEP